MTDKAVECDVPQVTLEDQKKINLFAQKNIHLNELRANMEDLKKELENVEDASDDLLMMDGDDELVSFKIGEVFIEHTQDQTGELLKRAKADLNDQIQKLEQEEEKVKDVMKQLKVHLYAKFGDNINLEAS